MKVPRFRIAWGMAFVALAALYFTVLRAAYTAPGPAKELLALGAMPMATVLTIGFIVGYRRHGSRPFLLGFESFGATALALFVVVAARFGEEAVFPYLSLFIEPLAEIIGKGRPAIL